MRPETIERLSFEIIDKEAGTHDFEERKWQIIRRMIHTSADFDYLHTVRFHAKAIEAGITAIQNGKPIITDTQMVKSGIRKKEIERFGGQVVCLIGDSHIAEMASKNGTTRALAAVDTAMQRMKDGIFVVGNAPTALLRIIEHIREQNAAPALVVGLPVGFVNAAESKAALVELDIPYISNIGRKGGSNIAASVVNALAIMAAEAAAIGNNG